MDTNEFCRLARRLMLCPAVPRGESRVRAEAERVCREEALPCQVDRFGNLRVHWQPAPRSRPLVLAAHLDHPGFQIVRPLSSNRWRARFLGGVPDEYFRAGVRLRLMPGGTAAVLGKPCGDGKEFEILSRRAPAFAPQFAVWELEDFAVRSRRIYGRACDDLIGAACILATLIDLKRSRARVQVIGVLARAEEIGFQGALTAAASGSVPKDALVISLETSKEIPPVKMGNGVIVRVGDRASVFDSAATRFLGEVGECIARRSQKFRYQRALMSGGTCEATAYQEFGFQTAAVCVALGNYHNCGARNRIRPEFVSVDDACGMVRLLVAAACDMKHYDALVGKLPRRLRGILRAARIALRQNGG